MKLKISISFLLLAIVSTVYGQQFRGRVLSKLDSLPIAGANIVIAKQAMATNNNGGFTINLLPGSHTLAIKATGYQQLTVNFNFPATNNQTYYLTPAIVSLNQVEINTGYQHLPKERANGSFTVINQETYNQQIGTNALERLRYISNGVAPVSERIAGLGKDPMLIRGMSTLTLSIQRPLVIVDNFEYQGDLENINPNDIENVTFLKDAAAGSIWGAKAANGVIVLTTKKGKFSAPLNITASSNLTLGSKPNLGYIPEIAATDLIEVERFLFGKQYKFTDTAKATHPVFSEVYELLFKNRAGRISNQELEQQLQRYGQQDVRNEFHRHFYQQAINRQHAVALSMGTDKLAMSFSLGHDDNSNVLAAKYQRTTLRLANQFKLSDALRFSLETSYTDSKQQSGRPAYGSINLTGINLPVYTAFADQNGEAIPLYTQYRQGYIDQLGGGKLLDWKYYPLTDYQYNTATTSTAELNNILGLNLKLLPSLFLDVKYRYQKQWQELENNYTEDSYFARNLINLFTQINPSGVVSYKVPKGAIRDLQMAQTNAQNLRGQLNFDKEIGAGNFNMLLGTEWSQVKNASNRDRSYGYNAEVMGFTNVDLVNTYPQIISGSNGFIPSLKDFSATNNRFVSFFANGAYTLRNKYTLSASARRDASNLFGVATNNKWNPFWSLGLGWNLSKEKFMEYAWLNELKLKATFGYQGNMDAKKVAVTTLTYWGDNPYTQTRYNDIANFPNPNLRWEKVGMLNLGTDFRLWGGRLSGSAEYYRKTMDDLYANVEIDRTTGIASGFLTRNVGQAIGHGWDIELKTAYHLGTFRLAHDAIFNTYQDKITKLNAVPELGRQTMSGGFVAVKGYGANAIFAYRWIGLDPTNGDPIGYLNGAETKNYSAIVNQTKLQDAVYIGTQFPRTFGSFGTTLSWHNLGLSIRATYKLNYFFKRESINYSNLISKLSGHADYALRWQKPGDEVFTNVPSFVYPAVSQRDAFYNASEIMFLKGDHVRLQYVNLSYSIQKAKIKKLPFAEVKVFSVANNLGIIWRKNSYGLDPDVALMPNPLQVAFGLNVKFK